ncbi:hypothetical protein LY90DRAFT_521736 [Neocallimastix californiae]|uniref:Uncharacterized protein n=1 Tax=Neocallimastix californiae TaxID=1754190 RepID=A0A1Y1X3T1_9FUNG|nr:hypothetical protein LY90DRAFT_521736 [Neocallimastix californiae]|eukprot:ORX80315.1 hypothetical protein LY90DRAFT_521736 [Neocallimastix californiae]
MHIIQLIFLICLINNQIIYSFGSNNILYFSYENITEYLTIADKKDSGLFTTFYIRNKPIHKTEVLKIKNERNLSYFCKNDICVKVDRDRFNQFLEIPDEKGNINRYISRSIAYEDLKIRKYPISKRAGHNIVISFKCASDSQCLTNKCIDGYCIFNEENPVEFCTNIYINLFIFKYLYMHCGKAMFDICKKNSECASKNCINRSYCGFPSEEPSDSDDIQGMINLLYLILLLNTVIPVLN